MYQMFAEQERRTGREKEDGWEYERWWKGWRDYLILIQYKKHSESTHTSAKAAHPLGSDYFKGTVL